MTIRTARNLTDAAASLAAAPLASNEVLLIGADTLCPAARGYWRNVCETMPGGSIVEAGSSERIRLADIRAKLGDHVEIGSTAYRAARYPVYRRPSTGGRWGRSVELRALYAS